MGEHAVQFAQPVLEDLREAEQDRQIDAPHLKTVDELLEIDALRRILIRVDEQVTVWAHREITVAPACDLIEIGGVRGAPVLQVEIDRHSRPSLGKRDQQMFRTAISSQDAASSPSKQSVASLAPKAMAIRSGAAGQTLTRVHPGRATIAAIASPRAVRSAAIASHAPRAPSPMPARTPKPQGSSIS